MTQRIDRKWFWLLLFITFGILTLLAWLVIGFHRDYQNIPPRHLVGNRPSTVAALKPKGFPFSFLVIGDTTGSETAETLIRMAFEASEASLMVILGDFVRRPDLWSHRFFLTEMTVEASPAFPVFLVAGNHDIDFTSRKIARAERRVTPEMYESLYGARNFDFVFNDCLFVICGVDLHGGFEYLSYLRKVLFERGPGKKHIFIFIHYPPKGLTEHIKGPLPFPEEFLSLLENQKVTACFFGHYHGYWRGQRKGVDLFVSGGGGRLKHYQPEWGKFQHILRVTVDQDRISEEMIVASKRFGLEDRFEETVFTLVFPFIQDRGWILSLTFIALLMISVFSFFKFAGTLRACKRNGTGTR